MKSIAALVFAFVVAFSVPAAAHAQLPFGGPILLSFPCTCSPGYYVVVGPPRGGAFVYIPPAILYANFNIYRPGAYVLGKYTPGGICMMAATPCFPLLVTGTINFVGTSL